MSNVINNTVNPESRNDTEVNFTGIFGQGGLLAALDSSEQPTSPSSLLLKIIKQENSTTHDNEKQCHVRSATKLKSSTPNSDNTPHPSCFQKEKFISTENAFGSAQEKVAQFNSARSVEERVESIDHILKSIVSELDRETLLKCRLVSLRWASVGAKALEGIVETRVKRYRLLDEWPYYDLDVDPDKSLNIYKFSP